ncbi:TPA: hypothetical protein QCU37_005521 [Bacillus cereus]|nr:hypothetical protein [Bacillus cereus]
MIRFGSGGFFTGEDAYEKIKSGASFVQLYTSFRVQLLSISRYFSHISNFVFNCLFSNRSCSNSFNSFWPFP